MVSKQLYILRHTRADAPPRGGSDRDRPLAAGGHRDAAALARKMRQDNLRPDAILCSPARRTCETLEPIRKVWPGTPVDIAERLYLASAGDLYECIKAQPDKYDSILLVGHNPGVHGLVQLLSGGGDPHLMLQLMTGYQTGSLAVLTFKDEKWAGLQPGGGRLSQLFVGKQLP